MLSAATMKERIRSRTRRRAAVGAAIVVASLLAIFPATALAWSSYYVQNTSFNPGGIGLSDFNSNLNYHVVTFTSNGYGDLMQLTLCDASYSCYSYMYSDSSFRDTRSISYGRAKCNAWDYNYASLYINYCYISN